MDDMEGGNGAGEAGTHWVVFDIRPEARELRAGKSTKLGGKLGRTEGGPAAITAPALPGTWGTTTRSGSLPLTERSGWRNPQAGRRSTPR